MAQVPLDAPGDTLAAAERALRDRRAAEAEILRVAVAWADQHPGETIGRFAYTPRGAERAIRIGGEGTPLVEEFCPAELGASLELHPLGARSLMADALDMRDRLPSLWALVTEDLAMPDWVARKIARATRALSGAQVAAIDRRLAEIATTLPPSRLLEVVDAMVLAAMDEEADAARKRKLAARFVTITDGKRQVGPPDLPLVYGRLAEDDALRLDGVLRRLAEALAREGDADPIDVRRSRALGLLANPELALHVLNGGRTGDGPAPPTTLYLHLTDRAFTRDEGGVVRFEGGGPITVAHAREILGHSRVTIRPVIDLEKQRPADAYEFTGSLRESVLLRTPADCYPYAVNVGGKLDMDHTTSYDADGPPGQTAPDNAGPMTRHHHRIKTHGRMAVRQPRPGYYVWRTPHGRYLATDHLGTRRVEKCLGDGLYEGGELERRLVTLAITAPQRRMRVVLADDYGSARG